MIRRLLVFVGLLLAAAPPGALAAQAADSARFDAVTLQPGDMVKVTVWREPDLSGEFMIDPDGVVTLPLIGEQRVAGVPVREMRRRLTELYRQNLRNPAITITPLRRINVLGEVQKPGMYPVDPTMSLAGVVAQAGGVTPNGRMDRIRIVRGDQVLRERVGAAETLNSSDIRSGDQVIVERRGWLDRNSGTVLASAVSLLSGIITTVIIINN